jgi:hypothetical protein
MSIVQERFCPHYNISILSDFIGRESSGTYSDDESGIASVCKNAWQKFAFLLRTGLEGSLVREMFEKVGDAPQFYGTVRKDEYGTRKGAPIFGRQTVLIGSRPGRCKDPGPRKAVGMGIVIEKYEHDGIALPPFVDHN